MWWGMVRNRASGILALGVLSAALLLGGLTLRSGMAPSSETDGDYLRWLEERSMLSQGRQAARAVSGSGVQWRHPYGRPNPRQAVRQASVWLFDYPGSVITRPGQSVLAAWGDPLLWDALADLGVDLLHTGPVNRAGGVKGTRFTPTLDGWFDRISLDLDPALGDEQEYARMIDAATRHGCLVAGDLVPLHTGLGPDFQLALRAYKDYPGMYTMVQVARPDWSLLPDVRDPWQFARVSRAAAEQLARKGYLPGVINSNDAAADARSWSGWSASGEVRGADGLVRRWVYLHYFKPSQPTLDWLDPSFAAPRAIAGDVVRMVRQRKTRILRLDAVPFLGIELRPGSEGAETWHYQHPLSVTATNELAFLIRKLGGWSFQELNIPLVELKKFTRNGPDLSYDFFTRTQYLHALLTGNASPLRLAHRWLLDAGVPSLSLVHDLQNHDEITYQLVELDHRKDELLQLGGEKVTGKDLRERVLAEMRARTAGEAPPYNKLYRPERDGLATTFAGFIAPALGIRDPYQATPEEVRLIRRGHLLLAAANAFQPGVFSLSGWDLVGALPISLETVQQRTADGDYRWINRGGVDLMGANPDATTSTFGLDRAKDLYGPLPEQLRDPDSFASALKRLIAARRQAGIAEGELIAVPEPKNPSVCLLVFRLRNQRLAVTALNFGRTDVKEELALRDVKSMTEEDLRGQEWTDAVSGRRVPAGEGRLPLSLSALTGTIILDRANGTSGSLSSEREGLRHGISPLPGSPGGK